MGLTTKVKRGNQSINRFGQAFGMIITVTHSIIAVLELHWFIKIAVIVFVSFLVFYMCFLSSWGRNKIVGIFNKIENKVEVRKHS